LSFLTLLDLLDLSWLTNIHISHDPSWLTISSKLPSDIPKFDGNLKEDPYTHIMIYHLWCSSNSLMDDSLRLNIFYRSLNGSAAKWYIELKYGSFKSINDLETTFLTHYQFPIMYDIGTDLLTSLH
jgi:hypothetical protein